MISIIGAGPAGLLTAFELARAGRQVTVHEEHSSIGKPVQCTGIVTEELRKTVPLTSNIIVNRIRKARIHSADAFAEIKTNDLVIDRVSLDSYLAERAENAGAKIRLGSRVKKLPKQGKIIGADGPASFVRKQLNPNLKVQFYIGKQVIVKGDFESDVFEVFLGGAAPGFFAWIVPENETRARVGLATMRNPDAHLKRFLKRRQMNIIEHQAGLIPIYNPKIQTQKGNAYLVGDSATQVKATTGGGLVPGLTAARILADSIANNKNYDTAWRKALGRELWMHLRIRKILNRFKDRDYNNLIGMLNPGVRSTLSRHNRDNSIRLTLALLMKQPGFLRFIGKLF